MAIDSNFNVINIQKYIYDLFSSKVATNTYCTNVPKVLKATDTDFIVIGLPTALSDFDAYGEIAVTIEIFVKGTDNGYQNNTKMKELHNKFLEIVEEENDKETTPYIFMKTRRSAFLDYDEQHNYHVIIDSFKIIIKN